jgi:hypothetical protein
MPPMAKSRFDYQNNRWACGNAALARRWYDDLECANPENVRASLAQTAGSRGAILIGEVSIDRLRPRLARVARSTKGAEGGQVPALAVHRERIGSSCRHRLGTEGMAQVVMASRARRSHPHGGLLLVGSRFGVG